MNESQHPVEWTARPVAPRDDDVALAQRVAAGDRAAFAGLMAQYNRRLYRLARAVLRDRTEAEDALQDAYLQAYRSMSQFRGEAALGTWLSRLVLNECLARTRRSARRDNVVTIVSANAGTDVNNIAGDDDRSPDQIADREQLCALLERKVDELPESFRAVFVLRSVEELTVEETALSLGLPEATVRSRYFRARSKLRDALAHDLDLAERNLFEFGGDRCAGVIAKVLERLAIDRDVSR